MSIEIARKHLEKFGLADRIQEFDVSSATVELAAAAVGVEGARICKTLSFQVPGDEHSCILIQAAGDARINNQKFKSFFGHKAKMLSTEDVKRLTGHEIGGVCAFGIENPKVKIYCDDSLKRFDTVFPAVGSDNSAIELSLEELFEVSGAAAWIDVTKLPEE